MRRTWVVVVLVACGGGSDATPDAGPHVDAMPVDCTAADPPLHASLRIEVGGDNGDYAVAEINDRPSIEIGLVDVEADGCVYVRPGAPFCDPACTDGVCGLDGACHPYPTGLDAGTVATTGTHPALTLPQPFPGSYFPNNGVPAGFVVPGETVGFTASGGTVAAFAGEVTAVASLELPTDDVTATQHQPMTIAWTPAPAGQGGQIVVRMNNDHHGTNSYVECVADDAAGQLTVPVSVLDPLIADGASGIGTYIESSSMTRRNRTIVATSQGCAAVESTSLAYLFVTTIHD